MTNQTRLITAQLDNSGRAITYAEAHACLTEAEQLVRTVLVYSPKRGQDYNSLFMVTLDIAANAVWQAKSEAALNKALEK